MVPEGRIPIAHHATSPSPTPGSPSRSAAPGRRPREASEAGVRPLQDAPFGRRAGRRPAIPRWYSGRGRPWLEKRVRRSSVASASSLAPVTVQDLGYRWGSCGRAGSCSPLAHRPAATPGHQYVVMHELVHLVSPSRQLSGRGSSGRAGLRAEERRLAEQRQGMHRAVPGMNACLCQSAP